MHVLIGGCGWLGGAIARALVARGDRVTAVRRNWTAPDPEARDGIVRLSLDLSDWHALSSIPADVQAVVSCASAGSHALGAYTSAYVEVNRSLLEWASRRRLRAYVYTSSTGVFGQQDGSVVNESTPVAPTGPHAEVLVEAERLVLAAAPAISTRIVRLSGLYGPERMGMLERVRHGKLALGPEDDTWMNFCHLDDAVASVRAALDQGQAGAAYHGSDAAPARRGEVVKWMAARLGIPPPYLRENGRLAGGRRGANRRIDATRTRQELGLTLRYPSFRDGFS